MEPHEEVEEPGRDLPSLSSASESDCRHVLAVARRGAARRGLAGEEAEDCALAFLLHLLLRSLPPDAPCALFVSEAWLARSADHWAVNAAQQRSRRCRVEAPWCALEAKETAAEPASQDADASPVHRALRSELVERLCGAVRLLTPAQQDLFLRHCLAGETAAEIALADGKRPGTVRKALTVLRRRLHSLLAEQGMDADEAADYLALLRPEGRAGRR